MRRGLCCVVIEMLMRLRYYYCGVYCRKLCENYWGELGEFIVNLDPLNVFCMKYLLESVTWNVLWEWDGSYRFGLSL